MTERIKITKLDAARRQLETAVLLYFNEGDPVSVHTLAAASHGILKDLGSREDSPMMLGRGVAYLPQELRDRIEKMMRIPQNFFKHADHDADGFLDFAPGLTELILLDAMAKYIELTGEKTLMLRAYEVWFGVRHPEFWDHTPQRDLIRQAKEEVGAMSRIAFLSYLMAGGLALKGIKPSPGNTREDNRAPHARRH